MNDCYDPRCECMGLGHRRRPATIKVTAMACQIAITTATNVLDEAVRLVKQYPSAGAVIAVELAMKALQLADGMHVGDSEAAITLVNAALEAAGREVAELNEARREFVAQSA